MFVPLTPTTFEGAGYGEENDADTLENDQDDQDDTGADAEDGMAVVSSVFLQESLVRYYFVHFIYF